MDRRNEVRSILLQTLKDDNFETSSEVFFSKFVFIFVFSKGIGLLARNYKPKLMEIPKLHQFNPAKIRKKIKKTKHKYTQKGIYVGGEMWKTIHSR